MENDLLSAFSVYPFILFSSFLFISTIVKILRDRNEHRNGSFIIFLFYVLIHCHWDSKPLFAHNNFSTTTW